MIQKTFLRTGLGPDVLCGGLDPGEKEAGLEEGIENSNLSRTGVVGKPTR